MIGAGDGSSRIEWLELFFDLVAVAAVAVLTEGLREDVELGRYGAVRPALHRHLVRLGLGGALRQPRRSGDAYAHRACRHVPRGRDGCLRADPLRGPGERVRPRLPRSAPGRSAWLTPDGPSAGVLADAPVRRRDRALGHLPVGRHPVEVLVVGPRAHARPRRRDPAGAARRPGASVPHAAADRRAPRARRARKAASRDRRASWPSSMSSPSTCRNASGCSRSSCSARPSASSS